MGPGGFVLENTRIFYVVCIINQYNNDNREMIKYIIRCHKTCRLPNLNTNMIRLTVVRVDKMDGKAGLGRSLRHAKVMPSGF